MNAMKRNFLFIILLLALFTGQAEAQRRLPGMKAVRFTTEMVDGFYSRANRHDAGYAFSLAVSTCTGNGNQWMFGGEMLKRNIPYRSTHIPLSLVLLVPLFALLEQLVEQVMSGFFFFF